MIRAVLLMLLMLASQLEAETIKVQSGEHPGFTRLVLAIPAGRDWQLGRLGDGYVVESGDITDSFDLSSAFDLIGRDRLASLDPASQPGQLRLDLACDCHATAFRWQQDWVVVDIADGPATPGSPFEIAIGGTTSTAAGTEDSSGPSLNTFAIPQQEGQLADFVLEPVNSDTEIPSSDPLLPIIIPVISGADLPNAEAQTPIIQADEIQLQTMAEAEPVPNVQISATEQEIIESFARAASQGLLDITVAPPLATDPDTHAEQPGQDDHELMTESESLNSVNVPDPHPDDSAPGLLAEFGLLVDDPDQPGVISRTSVDQNERPPEAAEASSSMGDRCLDETLLDMEDWGDERDFSTQIGERLSALTAEFDVYPEGSVEALAQSYLYFGFGREALQALDIDGVDSQQRRVMAAMAHVADEEPDPSGLFESQLGCATQAAIWTTLSRGTLADTTEAERVAVTEGFRALPLMLRGHLGVKLAQIFVDFGDAETAQDMLESAQDQVTAARVETELTSTAITLEIQGPEAAIPELGNIAATDIRLTPQALVQLINLTLDEGHSLDQDLITLADSMVYEYRGDAVEVDLIAAQVRALTVANAFDQAFELLNREESPIEPAQLAALRGVAILALTERAEDPAFLNFAFDTLPETGNAGVENAVATRLFSLGFADRADAVLNSPASGAEAQARKYLQADIAIVLGNYAAVETLLDGMSDPRAIEIKSRALAAQGDFAAASSTQNALPGASLDPDEAWRAGEWSVLEQSDDPLLRAASDAILAVPEALDPEMPLASSRALLDQAAATQDLAGQLLDRFAIEPATVAPGTN